MYKYFIAYVWSVDLSDGIGNSVADMTTPVRTAAHIEYLAARIEETEKRLPAGARVTITNIVSLDWPS